MLRHAQDILTLGRDRARGRAALEAHLQETAPGGQLPKDKDLLRVRTYSFTALMFDSGKAQDYAAVLELFERELDTEIPERCALALTEDTQRSLLVVRSATGQLLGYFEENRQARLPAHLGGFVPEEALEALRGCEKVEVFARPPLHGRAGLLPANIAWSYRTRSGPAAQVPSGKAIHLVVKDVALSPQRVSELGQLNPWKPSFAEGEEHRLLEGSEATPSRVLAAMREATEIDLVSHGVISPSSVEASVVLAPEAARDAAERLTHPCPAAGGRSLGGARGLPWCASGSGAPPAAEPAQRVHPGGRARGAGRHRRHPRPGGGRLLPSRPRAESGRGHLLPRRSGTSG